jgi:hypothetical protein
MDYAQIILQQLGGNKFIAMTGSKGFVKNDKNKSLTMKLTKNLAKAQYLVITLNGMDLYDMEFISINKNFDRVVKAQHNNVYNDMLQTLFTETTGLLTKF